MFRVLVIIYRFVCVCGGGGGVGVGRVRKIFVATTERLRDPP